MPRSIGGFAEMPEKLVSVYDAAEQTGLTHWAWRRWAALGRVSSAKLGRRLLIPASEVERVIAEGMRPRRREAWEARP